MSNTFVNPVYEMFMRLLSQVKVTLLPNIRGVGQPSEPV